MLFPPNRFVHLSVSGISYNEHSFFSPPLWELRVTRGVLPFWGSVLVALTEVRRMRKIYLRRHQPAGHCTRCGYDLRASYGRCPECGEPM